MFLDLKIGEQKGWNTFNDLYRNFTDEVLSAPTGLEMNNFSLKVWCSHWEGSVNQFAKFESSQI